MEYDPKEHPHQSEKGRVNRPGQCLELYFIDGKPDGMLTAQLFNWTGLILMTPRTKLAEALGRREAKYTGVYLLFGHRKDGTDLAYIGKGEDMSDRIRQHEQNKDWWTKVVLVTSQANTLNKAHSKYFEARLVGEATNIGRINLENINMPAQPSLKEAEQANMEGFLDYLLMVLPAIGIDAFKQNKRPKIGMSDDRSDTSPIFELVTKKHGFLASAILEDGDFVVLENSRVQGDWKSQSTSDSSDGKLHSELLKGGVLIKEDEGYCFTQNFAFTSPSAAASVVNGRPTSGPRAWKVKGTGKTYKAWEKERLDRTS